MADETTTIDPQMKALLERLAGLGLAPYYELSLDEAREAAIVRQKLWNEKPEPVARVEDITVKVGGAARNLRLYDPAPDAAALPAVLYLHGGGWVVGSCDSHDSVCRRLANASGMRFASLDYGLAPEHPFPQAIEESVDAFMLMHGQAANFGFDPKRLAVAGDSAGANLAVNVALAARERNLPMPRAAVLVYGTYSAVMDRPSQQRFGGGEYVLSTKMMEWFMDHYAPDPAQRRDPRIELVEADLAGLPPLYASIAELDPLRDEGELFIEKARAAGVEVERHLWRGVTHAALQMVDHLDQVEGHVKAIAEFLRRRLDA